MPLVAAEVVTEIEALACWPAFLPRTFPRRHLWIGRCSDAGDRGREAQVEQAWALIQSIKGEPPIRR